MTLAEALTLVCHAAEEYAGEYGYGMPEYCTEIFKAVEMIENEFLNSG